MPSSVLTGSRVNTSAATGERILYVDCMYVCDVGKGSGASRGTSDTYLCYHYYFPRVTRERPTVDVLGGNKASRPRG